MHNTDICCYKSGAASVVVYTIHVLLYLGILLAITYMYILRTETRSIVARCGHRSRYAYIYIYIYIYTRTRCYICICINVDIYVYILYTYDEQRPVEWRSRASCKRSITGARHRGFPMAVICH